MSKDRLPIGDPPGIDPKMEGSKPRRLKNPGYITSFGRELRELSELYGFQNKELSAHNGGLLTRTNIEQLSRMTRSVDAIYGTRAPKREALIENVAESIGRVFQNSAADEPVDIDELKESLRARLIEAVNRDMKLVQEGPIAVFVGMELSKLTDRSVRQLYLDLTQNLPPEELKKRWFNKE